jgi:hypothetical protein
MFEMLKHHSEQLKMKNVFNILTVEFAGPLTQEPSRKFLRYTIIIEINTEIRLKKLYHQYNYEYERNNLLGKCK